MSSVFHLTEVKTNKEAKDFIAVNVTLNQNSPQYIRPLDKDIHDIFDPVKNNLFHFGKAIRWILRNEQNKLIGRIAAFTNSKYKNKNDDFPVGGIGFFDCIDNQEVANFLFNTAKSWLKQQGMEGMDGPINFGDRNSWWGLVIEGFQEPTYHMNFNPPYYKKLFESYGFQVFYHQFCFGTPSWQNLNPKFLKRHAKLKDDRDLTIRSMNKNQIEKYAYDFCEIYNAAWKKHEGLKEMTPAQAVVLFKKMKPVMDERIVWFIYHKERPIAMYINLPDLNQWFKFLNGKFGLLQKLKFLWIKRVKPCKRFIGLVFGIVPEFQKKGIDAYLITEAQMRIPASYSECEMQWIGDFNPKMISIASKFGALIKRTRTLATYRYSFCPNRELKRHPMLSE